MDICIDKTNKSFVNLDNNLAELESKYAELKTKFLKIEDNPDDPNFEPWLIQLRSISDKIYLMLRS